MNELRLDVHAHLLRSLGPIAVGTAAWWLIDWLSLPVAGALKYAVASLTAVALLARVIVWLRLWGAYVERQLVDLQALLSNQRPAYYTGGDLVDFDHNPLFSKLEGLEPQPKE